jgi:hypothetical protein
VPAQPVIFSVPGETLSLTYLSISIAIRPHMGDHA